MDNDPLRNLYQAVLRQAIFDCMSTHHGSRTKAQAWLFGKLAAKDRKIVAELAGINLDAWMPTLQRVILSKKRADKTPLKCDKVRLRHCIGHLIERHGDYV